MFIGSLLALALAAASPEAPTSSGAPADDYGFVAWCHGALSGHMEMRELVREELDALSPGPPDDDILQRAAGEEYLELYTRALRAAENASPTTLQNQARTASARGYAMWSEAKTADPRNRMWAYLMWELPGQCEVAATRLEERSSLFGEALRPMNGDAGAVRPLAATEGGSPAAPVEGLRGPQ